MAPIPEDRLNVGPIDFDPNFDEMLKDIQGNILKDHGRDFAVHIFLQFNEGKENDVMQWIRKFEQYVTSAMRQQEDTQHRTEGRDRLKREGKKVLDINPGLDDRPFVNFFISAQGYEYLKQGTPPEQKGDSFKTGMKQAGQHLEDPDSKKWENGYRNTIHAMLLIANDDRAKVAIKKKPLASLGGALSQAKIGDSALWKLSDRIAKVLTIERGQMFYQQDEQTQKEDKTRPQEHFGYIDGLSNPLFFSKEIPLTKETWDPSAFLNLVLVPDPGGGEHAAGSFLVFRKLEQNVSAFLNDKIKHAKTVLNRDYDGGIDLAGALTMGRFKDGTPVTRAPSYVTIWKKLNDFDYGPFDVPGASALPPDAGARCPLSAHIRLANPREHTRSNEEKAHRIVRRGMTYGNRTHESFKEEEKDPNKLPTRGVGLLFMCFQSCITTQFEYIQRRLNGMPPEKNSKAAVPRQPLDPVAGQSDPSTKSAPLAKVGWAVTWGEKNSFADVPAFQRCITLKGGEYFFAPSKSFLRNIS